MGTTDERLRQIVADSLGVSITEVVPDARFVEDLGASLDFFEMIMTCEEEFGLVIPDEEAAQLSTVAQLFAYLNDRLEPPGDVWPPPPRQTV